jgi:hypothetical protein
MFFEIVPHQRAIIQAIFSRFAAWLHAINLRHASLTALIRSMS